MASTIVSEKFVRNLVADQTFFTDFPEFSSLRKVLDENNGRKRVRGGCRRCGRGKKPEQRLLSGFITILRSLDPERVAALKQRTNVQKLQFNGYNHIRGTHEVMTL
jgi:hypothetical protein